MEDRDGREVGDGVDGVGNWGRVWGHFPESSGQAHLWEFREAGWRERLGYCTPTPESQKIPLGKAGVV